MLKQKTEELSNLKEKVVDCKCLVPVDVPVQVKRTPSFAALCQCRPEDNFLVSQFTRSNLILMLIVISIKILYKITLNLVLLNFHKYHNEKEYNGALNKSFFQDSCSCTSLRTTLLSNMLSDLFGGLQSELGFTGSNMPCQLLKCLEDGHNWDSSSIVKTNLRNFFSKLLIAELDIAITTAIENYHARVTNYSIIMYTFEFFVCY